jgi:hypothetical protein
MLSVHQHPLSDDVLSVLDLFRDSVRVNINTFVPQGKTKFDLTAFNNKIASSILKKYREITAALKQQKKKKNDKQEQGEVVLDATEAQNTNQVFYDW